MQVYDNRYIERHGAAARKAGDAIVAEAKSLTFGANIIFYTLVGTLLCIGLGAIWDHEIFRFALPMGFIASASILNASVSLVRYNAWKKRKEAEDDFFKASTELAEYNTNKVHEMMAMRELALAASEDAPPEYRIIN